jgi:hypothetical protein
VLAVDRDSHALGGFVDIDQKLGVSGLAKRQHRDGGSSQWRNEAVDTHDEHSSPDPPPTLTQVLRSQHARRTNSRQPGTEFRTSPD